jgi:hypothetical protein
MSLQARKINNDDHSVKSSDSENTQRTKKLCALRVLCG